MNDTTPAISGWPEGGQTLLLQGIGFVFAVAVVVVLLALAGHGIVGAIRRRWGRRG